MVAAGVERGVAPDLLQRRPGLGVRRADDAVADPTVVTEEVEHAELGYLRHRLLDDRASRAAEVKRGVEVAGRADEEVLSPAPALLGGDVAGDDRGADDAAAGVLDRRDRQRDVETDAVLADPLGLIGLESLARAHPVEDLLLLVLVVGGDEEGDVAANGLLGAVAVESLGGGVPGGDDPL